MSCPSCRGSRSTGSVPTAPASRGLTTLGSACACAKKSCGSVGTPFDPAVCAPVAVLTEPTTTCCLVPLCGRLRVVILCQRPCSPIPGYEVSSNTLFGCRVANSGPPGINAPPATPITAGVPYALTLAGRPSAYADFGPLPEALASAFGRANIARATSLVFDFGSAGAVNTGWYKEAQGRVLAVGAAGAAQASLNFVYRWCAPLKTCNRDATVPAFQVVDCTSRGLTFVVLDDTSYLSTDPCTESIVVLNVQQYCPEPLDSTPATVGVTSPCVACPRPLQISDLVPMKKCATCPRG